MGLEERGLEEREIKILRCGAQPPSSRLRGYRSFGNFCSFSTQVESRRLRPIAEQFIATASLLPLLFSFLCPFCNPNRGHRAVKKLLGAGLQPEQFQRLLMLLTEIVVHNFGEVLPALKDRCPDANGFFGGDGFDLS